MQKKVLFLGFACLANACGSSNFNSFFASKQQKAALDQLLIHAQFEFDQGNNETALELTEEALKVNPYEEKTLLLRAFTYLSKAGLDGFGISKNLIKQTDTSSSSTKASTSTTSTSTTTDATTSNLDSLASVVGLTEADFEVLGTSNIDTGTKVYYPLSRTLAREADSTIIENINAAVLTLCPIIQVGAPKDSAKDPRHDCVSSPLEIQGQAKSHFAWALAHLGEAIAFYSVVLYDDKKVDASGKALGPNIQRVSSSLDQTNTSKFLNDLTTLSTAINKIFPTKADDAADSMLNAMFNDLKVIKASFAAMAGVPESVTKSIDDSISNLESKISKVSTSTDSSATSDASKQNAAIRNALTTTVAANLESKISKLSDTQKTQACTLYQQINSDPSKKPSGC
ncbi:MAG: hypothetical protein NTX25_21575 [Proteobacteria bacterium]|nr:hypothetical protein [Pseudomonadota bacterium]